MADLNTGAEKQEQIVVGWSPDGDESRFALSPTKFCRAHKLSACQSGILRFLSRYQFEKNPWLVDESRVLVRLLLEFGAGGGSSLISWFRLQLGVQPYLAPRIVPGIGFSLSNYCLVNGISPQIALIIGLVCNKPTAENLSRADRLMEALKARR